MRSMLSWPITRLRKRASMLTCPPLLGHLDAENFTEARTDCKPRANNCHLGGVERGFLGQGLTGPCLTVSPRNYKIVPLP